MRKRTLSACRLLLLVAVFLFWSQVASQAKTIGIMMTGDIPYYHAIHQTLLDEMSSYFSQENIEIVLQTPLPNPMSWTNSARKLSAGGQLEQPSEVNSSTMTGTFLLRSAVVSATANPEDAIARTNANPEAPASIFNFFMHILLVEVETNGMH